MISVWQQVDGSPPALSLNGLLALGVIIIIIIIIIIITITVIIPILNVYIFPYVRFL